MCRDVVRDGWAAWASVASSSCPLWENNGGTGRGKGVNGSFPGSDEQLHLQGKQVEEGKYDLPSTSLKTREERSRARRRGVMTVEQAENSWGSGEVDFPGTCPCDSCSPTRADGTRWAHPLPPFPACSRGCYVGFRICAWESYRDN